MSRVNSHRSLRDAARLMLVAGFLAGCPGRPTQDGGDASQDGVADGAVDAPADVTDPSITDCDPLVPGVCSYPWPSNLYLQPDATRRTGFTLAFGPTSLPENGLHRHANPAPLRRLDGYGVGVPIMVLLPNVDGSQFPDEEHIEQSLAPDAKALLFEAHGDVLTRVPYWAELDSHQPDPARRTLFVRPAVILDEATRYVVAFRNVNDTSGHLIAPSAAFVALRDRQTAAMASLAPRQARFDAMFSALEASAIPRASLTLAWDFNTASGDALHGILLEARDAAFAITGPMGPRLTVTRYTEYVQTADGSGREVDANIAFELFGTFEVPSFLEPYRNLSVTGTVLNLDPAGHPMASGTRTPHFWIRVPWGAVDGTRVPHGILQYGHGLLGSGDESRAGYLGEIANRYHLITVAADLTGMSFNEFPSVLGALDEMGNFVAVADTLHQGLVEWTLLGRAARERLDTEQHMTDHHVVVNHAEVFYSGNSQGGIFGGTFVAISPDVRFGHLGVPGNNYATLLHRSHDFTRFFDMLQSNYPNIEDQAVGIAALQLFWDTTDPVSYLRHITAEPFDPASPHYAIFTPAKGDHQVAAFTNEIAARSNIGIALMAHYDYQRTPARIDQAAYPHRGSGVVLYDFGNPWPSPGNHVPEDMGPDPHELPRRAAWEQAQVVHFFRSGGEIIDVCGGDGCRPD